MSFGWEVLKEHGNFRLCRQTQATPTYFVVFQHDSKLGWTYQIRNRRASAKTGTTLFNRMAGLV